MNDLLKAAKRMRDALTVDGDPPTLAIPDGPEGLEFTRTFSEFCEAIAKAERE